MVHEYLSSGRPPGFGGLGKSCRGVRVGVRVGDGGVDVRVGVRVGVHVG